MYCFKTSTLLLKFFLQTFEFTSYLKLQIEKVQSPNKKNYMHMKIEQKSKSYTIAS